jgi:NAD(P)-dependent dehydrogenase (short-subunit alcohol dehydrogenase family)
LLEVIDQDESGPLDGLVNNAGIIRRADALDFSEADWDEVMNLNLKASFFSARPSPGGLPPNGAGASSTSPRCSPSRAASASPPTPPRKSGLPG